jgi:transcriptional regulator with PAS, ATPase and Fis domain
MSPSEAEASATRGPTNPRPVLSVRAVNIEVAVGPDAGRRVRVDSPSFVIGTGDAADFRLTDDAVSREHLRLSLLPTGVRLLDEGSRNGTWIGGIRAVDVTVSADTGIEIGSSRLILNLESSPLNLPLSEKTTFGRAIGASTSMRHLFAILERVAASEVTILLEGESGVGKEVLAQAIHAESPRAQAPFVAIDCGAIPAGLIESELFGHERGAFTGAHEARVGAFEQADGGTLFLDEIGELPLDLQPKLLRVLEQREVRPVGSRSARPFDARVIAATNRRLTEAANKGEFRRDLFYRLAVARVTIPPLRERREDIVPLALAFLRSSSGSPSAELEPELAALLASYAWPGNVRELRNVIERYAHLGVRDAGALFDGAQPRAAGGSDAELAELPFHEARRRVLDRFERAYIPRLLERAGGVVTRAAEMAEVARPSLYRMLERLRIPSGSDE